MRKNKIVGRQLASSTLMVQQQLLKGKATGGAVELEKAEAYKSRAPYLLLNDGVTNLNVVLT